jgi:hypothetical protein
MANYFYSFSLILGRDYWVEFTRLLGPFYIHRMWQMNQYLEIMEW